MSILLSDLHHAVRALAKHPGYLVTALLTLALGIGFSTATFSVIDAVLLRAEPYRDPSQLVVFRERSLPQFPEFSVSPGHYLLWRDYNTAFADIAAYGASNVSIDTGDGSPERVRADRVTANLFPLLGVNPILGRGFGNADDKEGAPPVVLLSYGAWQRRLGADRAAIGRTIRLDRHPVTVVGVMPPGFTFPWVETEMWVPMSFTAQERTRYGSHYLAAIGRLKPGATLKSASADMARVAERVVETDPGSKGWEVLLFNLQDYNVQDVRTSLYVLLGAVSLVLLIACVNVANLLLVRGAARHRELAIRSAIGATRARLLRQLLVEQVALATVSAVGGVLVAAWLLRVLLTMVPDALPRQMEIGIDGQVLAFALALAALTPLLFGLLPAVHASRPDVRALLDAGGRQGSGAPAQRVRTALVVVEMAFAMMLLVGAGLLIRSFNNLMDESPGFRPDHAIVAGVSLPDDKYAEGEPRERFFGEFLQRVEAIPQVSSAGIAMPMPMINDYNSGFEIEGQPVPPEGKPVTLFYAVSPGYFAATGTPLRRGRLISDEDRRGSRRVVVINQAIADRYFKGGDPIGHRMRVSQGGDEWREIVGVVGDVKQNGLSDRTRAQVYESWLQHPYFAGFNLVVRSTTDDPTSVVPGIRAILKSMDSELPLARVRTLDELVGETVRPQRFSTTLIGVFGAAALLLAGIGVYSVMAYTVGLRRQEFAIRVAHGASRSDILRLVMRGAVTMSLAGIAGGLLAAWLLRRALDNLLFGITAEDATTYVAVAVILTIVSLAASAIPALRATRVSPIAALRGE